MDFSCAALAHTEDTQPGYAVQGRRCSTKNTCLLLFG